MKRRKIRIRKMLMKMLEEEVSLSLTGNQKVKVVRVRVKRVRAKKARVSSQRVREKLQIWMFSRRVKITTHKLGKEE